MTEAADLPAWAALLTAALVLLGAALSLLPPVRESLRTTLLREVAVRFLDRLYSTVDQRPGIGRRRIPHALTLPSA